MFYVDASGKEQEVVGITSAAKIEPDYNSIDENFDINVSMPIQYSGEVNFKVKSFDREYFEKVKYLLYGKKISKKRFIKLTMSYGKSKRFAERLAKFSKNYFGHYYTRAPLDFHTGRYDKKEDISLEIKNVEVTYE